MTSLLRRRLGVAGALAAAAFLGPRLAAAAPDCNTLPNPVYATGGNSSKPFFAKLATMLTNAAQPVTIVLQTPGNCPGLDAIVNSGTKITGTASFWNAAGTETTCNLSLTGDVVQFGEGNTEPDSCPEITTVPADFGDYRGPVQAFDFIVPVASSQSNISAAAAYFVFGFGASGQAAPWTDESLLFTRALTSAVPLLMWKAINVPADKAKGVQESSSTTVITAVSGSAVPEKTLGIVADEIAQANSSAVRPLAYQHYGQDCGYWPSSTVNKLDKENVRDGHYFIWGYTHIYAHKGGNGKPTDPDVAKIVGYITGDVPPPAGVDPLQAAATAGAVPLCAMEVERDHDLGPLKSYAPDEPCGCAFENFATGHTSCTACPGGDGDCPISATHCRFGYCEVN